MNQSPWPGRLFLLAFLISAVITVLVIYKVVELLSRIGEGLS